MLYRAEVFRQVGLLEESFESYLEDVDFGLRCAAQRITGRYVPDARAVHVGSAALGRWHPETVRRIARNQLLLVARHYSALRAYGRSWSPKSYGAPSRFGMAADWRGRAARCRAFAISQPRGVQNLQKDPELLEQFCDPTSKLSRV